MTLISTHHPRGDGIFGDDLLANDAADGATLRMRGKKSTAQGLLPPWLLRRLAEAGTRADADRRELTTLADRVAQLRAHLQHELSAATHDGRQFDAWLAALMLQQLQSPAETRSETFQ